MSDGLKIENVNLADFIKKITKEAQMNMSRIFNVHPKDECQRIIDLVLEGIEKVARDGKESFSLKISDYADAPNGPNGINYFAIMKYVKLYFKNCGFEVTDENIYFINKS